MDANEADFYFDEGLIPLLGRAQREMGAVRVGFKGAPSVKHLVEALGVPHTEVGGVSIAGTGAGLEAHVHGGERVEVTSPQDGEGAYDRESEPKFIADNHVGRLAVYLRMLGYDTLYRNDYQDPELAQVAGAEGRILLTRDRRLLMRRAVRFGYCLRSTDPREQLTEVVRRYGLASQSQPFRRCLRCNQPLQPVAKADIIERLEPLTQLYFDDFSTCPGCEQVYWKGSHYEHMLELIRKLS
jgi:uncharacterized protein with PIN domain